MSKGCIPIEEMGSVSRLDPQDHRQQHLKSCARCRALMTAYRDFQEQARVRAGSDPAAAEARLSAFVEHDILGEDVESEDSSTAGETGLARLLRGLFSRPLRPALVLVGAAAVILVAVTLVDFGGETPDHRILRGDETTAEGGLSLNPPHLLDDDRVRLSWQAAEGADSYTVIFLGEELHELARLEAGGKTSLELQPSTIQALPGSGTPVLWRVSALSGGDEIARSRAQSMRLP